MTHIFVCPSLRGGLKLNKTRFQLRVNTTDYNWCLIPILSNSWKLVKSYSVVLHVNPYESLSRSSQQWISEPKAMFSQENTTHSKASQKLSSKLFPQKGNPFFNWGSLVAFNCYLASMPAAFARAPLDGAVPVGMPRCSMLFGDLFTVNPNPKNVKDHPNHPKSKTQFKSKSKQTTSNLFFVKTWSSLLQGLQCCADGGAVWSTSSGATGDMQRSRLRILREPGEMEMEIWLRLSWLFVLCFRKDPPKSYRWMWVSIRVWLDTWW